MGNSVNFKISSVALKKEVTENIYEPITGSTDYIEVKDGFVPEISREELEREILDGSREKKAPRQGVESASLPLPVELKANATEGLAPQVLGELFEGLLGQTRSVAEHTSDAGHTVNTLNMAIGEGVDYSTGDCFVIKEAGSYSRHAVESVAGDVITFFPSTAIAPSDSVVISKSISYYIGSSVPSFSAEVSYGQEQTDKLKGLKVASCSASVTAGQLPTCDFSMSGNREGRVSGGASFTGDFSSNADPAVAKSACAYFKFSNGDEEVMGYETFNLNLENEINDKLDACSSTGKGSPALGQITVGGDINPYMRDAADAQTLKRFSAFDTNEDVSVFLELFNPSAVSGESENHVLIYMPKVRFSNLQAADLNGLVTDAITFATAKGANNNESFFISFI